MQFVAAETVDWWKAADGTPLQDVPFGEFVPEREKRRRKSDNAPNTSDIARSPVDEHGYDSRGDDHHDCPTVDAHRKAAAHAGPGVDPSAGCAKRPRSS